MFQHASNVPVVGVQLSKPGKVPKHFVSATCDTSIPICSRRHIIYPKEVPHQNSPVGEGVGAGEVGSTVTDVERAVMIRSHMVCIEAARCRR